MTGAVGPIRVLIVDDHRIVRLGLEQLLATVPGVQVVGLAEDGDQAVAQADRLHPDVVVMDVRMPTMNGIDATRLIVSGRPECRVVILTANGSPSVAREAALAGASACLHKDGDPDELVRSVLGRAERDGDGDGRAAGPARADAQ